jgi:hypothetical protein
MTTLATGKDTTVIFVGDTGPPEVIGPMQAATAKAGGAASAGLNITHFPPTWAASGMPTYMKVAAGVGGAVVIGGAIAAGQGDNNPDLTVPTISNVNPPEGSFPGAGANSIDIRFNESMNPSFKLYTVNESMGTWANISDGWIDNKTFRITFTNFSMTSGGSMDITLDDFRDLAGNRLQGQPTLVYSIF